MHLELLQHVVYENKKGRLQVYRETFQRIHIYYISIVIYCVVTKTLAKSDYFNNDNKTDSISCRKTTPSSYSIENLNQVVF